MKVAGLMPFLIAIVPASATAQHGEAPAAVTPTVSLSEANDPYRPYAFLVGDWISQEGSSTLRQSIRWGPQRSYMLYSTYMKQPGGAERLHFEGMMAWNGKSGKLDFLFVVEPGSWAQERGSLHAELDGSIVREVELTAANGVVTQFRQTIRRVDANTAITSLMTRKEDGWEPNFPGSDRIEMRRQ